MIEAQTSILEEGWIYNAENGYSPDVVKTAVTRQDWQAVRLRMKGKTTAGKLIMLKDWRDQHLKHGQRIPDHVFVQIDNYLGALRRGGQLDSNNLVRKVR